VLEAIDGVSEAALFGDRLHALLADPGAAAAVGVRLEGAGFAPAAVRAIAPSLEDAFIHTISRAEAEPVPGGGPRPTAHGPRLGGTA